MNPLLTVVKKLVAASGSTDLFNELPVFTLEFTQENFDPLIIKSWIAQHSYFGETRHISVAHLCSTPEDPEPFVYPEVTMTEHGIPLEMHAEEVITVVTSRGTNTLVYTKARLQVEERMKAWAESIIAQGWLYVAMEKVIYRRTDKRTTEAEEEKQ